MYYTIFTHFVIKYRLNFNTKKASRGGGHHWRPFTPFKPTLAKHQTTNKNYGLCRSV